MLAQRQLAGMQAHTRSVIDNALDAVLSMDFEGRITDRNTRATSLFGRTAGDALGRDLPRRTRAATPTSSRPHRGTAMQHAENAVMIFHHLKAMGFRLSIDDFGTGYSSLAYLKRFPIDTIKIDRAFVKDLGSESKHAAIAIIAMAHGLKLRVLAEGMETQAQMDILRDHHCDTVHGYFFS
jgi:hypothetical protein